MYSRDRVQNIINKNVSYFIEYIEDKCDEKDFRTYIKKRAQFESLRLVNKEYYEYAYMEEILLVAVRENLINPVIFDLLDEFQIDFDTIPYDYHLYLPSNYEYERAHKVEFYLKDSKIGYRYTRPHLNKRELRKLYRKYRIKELCCINFDEEFKPRKHDSYLEISYKDFFSEVFNSEVSQIVTDKLIKAVQLANDLIGFKTIPTYSLRNIVTFRSDINSFIANEKEVQLIFEKNQRET